MTTQKKPATFRLSDEAHATLEDLAKRKRLNKTQAIELALREMAVSTKEQRSQQSAAKEFSRDLFLDDLGAKDKKYKPTLADLRRAFGVGYNKGWFHYQFRHTLERLPELVDLPWNEYFKKQTQLYLGDLKKKVPARSRQSE